MPSNPFKMRNSFKAKFLSKSTWFGIFLYTLIYSCLAIIVIPDTPWFYQVVVGFLTGFLIWGVIFPIMREAKVNTQNHGNDEA